jgi:hypothetical protein
MARLKNLISQYANHRGAFAFLALFAFFVSTLAFIHTAYFICKARCQFVAVFTFNYVNRIVPLHGRIVELAELKRTIGR